MTKFGYETEIGRIEKNLPFLSIRLPDSFKNTIYAKNLINNQHKLTTPFDMYQTLRHFLYLNLKDHEKSFSNEVLNDDQPKGISLFKNIPHDRSCDEAYIPDDQCVCLDYDRINEKEFKNKTMLDFKEAAIFLLSSVNNFTMNYRSKCELFNKYEVKSAISIDKQDTYRFIVKFQPGDAWFKAYLKVITIDKNVIFQQVGNIYRISYYGNTADCVVDSNLRNFCYCKKQS